MFLRIVGIGVGIIKVFGVGEFCKMDMVGYIWVFISNEYFIGKRIFIFLVLFDLSKVDEEIKKDLFYYLSLLKVREIKVGVFCFCLEVVLIVIYIDKVELGIEL